MKDITFYVSFPFCMSKCHFCTYVSNIKAGSLVGQENSYELYTKALKTQIAYYARRLKELGYRLKSVYFGGGTPTVFSTEQLKDILTTIRENTIFSENYRDVTLESTPEGILTRDCTKLLNSGFDRVSLGVQTMNDSTLKKIARFHNSQQVVDAVKKLKDAGFTNINIDLLIGLPDEDIDELGQTLQQVMPLDINHISTYIYVPVYGTVLRKNIGCEHTCEELSEKYLFVQNYLQSHGFHEYMLTYYSSNDKRCVCDETYFGLLNDWIGFGANANSLYNRKRMFSASDFRKYIQNPLKPFAVSMAADNLDFLETHFYWMLITENGLVLNHFEKMLGISFSELLGKSHKTKTWFNYLTRNECIIEKGGCICFKDNQSRVHFACKKNEIDYHPNENIREEFYGPCCNQESRKTIQQRISPFV